MKLFTKILIATFGLITLFSLHMHLMTQAATASNLLLIAFTYLLFATADMPLAKSSIPLLLCLGMMLDTATFMQTHIVGISYLFLVPASLFMLQIKDGMYNKIILPCLFIISYFLFHAIFFALVLNYAFSISTIMRNIMINTIIFCTVWTIAQNVRNFKR